MEKKERIPGDFTRKMFLAMDVGFMIGAGVFSLPHRFAAAAGVVGRLIARISGGSGIFYACLGRLPMIK